MVLGLVSDKLEELDQQNRLHYGKNNLYKKIYTHESKGVPIQNFWDDVYFISRSEKNKKENIPHRNLLNY